MDINELRAELGNVGQDLIAQALKCGGRKRH
jgi:hypothetical protein